MPSPNKEFEPPVRSYRFGDFELDISEDTLRKEGENLNINRRMFQVLLLLVQRRGEIVTKQEFFEKVWEGSFVEENNLTVTIAALRKVLGDDSRHATYIENLPRKGYRFIAQVGVGSLPTTSDDVAHGPTETRNGIRVPTAFSPPPTSRRSGWRVTGTVTACIFIALTIAAVGYKGYRASSASTAHHVDSIAILPFKSGDPGNDYLSDGITDGVINSLSHLSSVRVIDRNSAFQYKDKPVDPAEVCRELNVQSLVTGQIEKVDDTLIITVELTDMAPNSRPWRQQFRHSKGEIYAIQQEIVQAIARDVLSEKTEQNQNRASNRPTSNPEAYDLYLKGRYYWNKRSNQDLLRSVELFRAAIDKDPTFAKAYVGLANAYALAKLQPLGIGDEERVALAQGAAKKALEIDDNIGEAYAVIGINKVYHDWDLAGAESYYLRALELNPNDATSHHWYAELLSMEGRFDESYRQYEFALLLDPLSLPIRTDMGLAHYYAHDHDTAIEILNKAKELDPEYGRTYRFLAFAYREKEMFNESAGCVEKLSALQFQQGERSREFYDLMMRYAAGLRNASAEAGAKGFWQAELRSGPPGAIYRAVAYSKLGETDKAFEFLETAFKEHQTGMVWLKVTPEFDNIRSDPRYQDLLRRVGFRSG